LEKETESSKVFISPFFYQKQAGVPEWSNGTDSLRSPSSRYRKDSRYRKGVTKVKPVGLVPT